jgi:hypothetical protein
MNQNFSSDQTIKFCKRYELTEYGITKEKLLIKLDDAFNMIVSGTYEFSLSRYKNLISTTDLVGKLILRKLNDNIKRLYKNKQANRRIIIFQIKTLLEDKCDLWVYRTDISSFYPSINRINIIDKLRSDSMLSYFSLNVISKLFANPILINEIGIPLGIPISSTLSEIYMRKFDHWIRGFNGIYYYARFVDDIIVFNFKKEVIDELDSQITLRLASESLKKNENKTQRYEGNLLSKKTPLEFLGYKFYHSYLADEKNKIIVSIASDKIKKIKSRIIYSFIDFIKAQDEVLLENRIKFLTGNYGIKENNDGGMLKAGIYFNYSLVNEFSALKELNVFYHKTLNCKRYSLGVRLSPLISVQLKMRLSKYSFIHGFMKKVCYQFNAKQIKKISSCWT